MKIPLNSVLGGCFLIVFCALSGGAAWAHVSADSMPDSVAEVEYRIYLEFKPDDRVILNKLGMVYYRLNKLPDAVREFSRVLKLDPENADALDGMGLVKAAQGDYDGAISYHQQAIAINADDMMAYYHLGVALEKKEMYTEAAAAYRDSLERYQLQYPAGTDNAKAAEFAKTLEAAISSIEAKQ